MSESQPYSVLAQINSFRRPITVPEVAEILSLTRGTVYEMIKNGSLPAINLPGCRKKLFDPSVLAAHYLRYNRHARLTSGNASEAAIENAALLASETPISS